MRHLYFSRLYRPLLFAAATTGAAFFAGPLAHADEIQSTPQPVTQPQHAPTLTQTVTTMVNSWGIPAPAIDPQIAAAVDTLAQQVQAFVAPVMPYADPQVAAPAPERHAVAQRPVDGPNYHWANDPVSQVMAQKSGPVLHRVQGSWFNAPDIPEESLQAQAQGASLYGPGTPIYVGKDRLCTVGASGYDAEGRKVAITAGHCGNVGDAVSSADSWQVGPSGTVVAKGSNLDYAVVELGSNAQVTQRYNNVSVNAVGGPMPVTGNTACKQGVATGFSCGLVWNHDHRTTASQVCAMQGDSGAPMLVGDRVVGIINGGIVPNVNYPCTTPWQGPFFVPTISTNMDAIVSDLNSKKSVGHGFRLANS
ncbi:hypothetical protein FRC0135_00633 [Corynebacterium diphtheriae]|nr:hypothetical protein FRC0135_00633 [Corynebacterium diphtheriae]CAB0791445.1 hypothetical protein FRC0195_00691 [Corynebacterium diphtheriae]